MLPQIDEQKVNEAQAKGGRKTWNRKVDQLDLTSNL
jgi:hypothetical protein